MPHPIPPGEIRAAIARALAGPYVHPIELPPQGGPELAESGVSQAQQPLPTAIVAALHHQWQQGHSTRQAAAACGVSQSTASRYYRRFKADGE